MGESQHGAGYAKTYLSKVRAELEAPRQERPFGSGWLSGSIGLLAGIVGILMVIVLRNPSLTSVPQLSDGQPERRIQSRRSTSS